MIFDIMRYSVRDGPGIRTTVFLKGCPLDCWWCHNPEGKSMLRERMVFSDRCIGCGACEAACRNNAISGSGECIACGACAEACYADARVMVGRKVRADELLAEVLRDRAFYDQSGGGVTFSGGEPLAQPEFLLEVLSLCRREGLHTTIDTSGYCSPETLARVIPAVDLFLFDVKMTDEASHRKYTGVPFAPVRRNLERLVSAGSQVMVRIPLVPGINDDERSLSSVASLVSELGGAVQVTVLPYHKSGTAKYDRLGFDYRLQALENASEEDVARAVGILRSYGVLAGGSDS